MNNFIFKNSSEKSILNYQMQEVRTLLGKHGAVGIELTRKTGMNCAHPLQTVTKLSFEMKFTRPGVCFLSLF